MIGQPEIRRQPLREIDPPWARLWAIVLAGGEGVRLRSLARRVCGDERPKQYVPLLGARTLLRQTLDRVALEIPPSRTVVVTLRSHAGYFGEPFAGLAPRVLVQPADRGTAAGILFPAHLVSRLDPEAILAVFPSDHFVLEEEAFMTHVGYVAAWVNAHPDRLVLLGARPTEAEVEYGWVEPGEVLHSTPDRPIWEVQGFWEKPSEDRARLCLATGCLWNTFVLVGKATAFLRAGRETLPETHDRLAQLSTYLGTADEACALHQAYALLATASFSRAVLEARPSCLAVSALPEVTWSDLGSPRRVFQVLGRTPGVPSWVDASDLALS